MTLGQKIRQLRKERKWSIFYLAMELGCSHSTIYYYESDKRELVPKHMILAMCYVFGIDFDEFMKGVEF